MTYHMKLRHRFEAQIPCPVCQHLFRFCESFVRHFDKHLPDIQNKLMISQSVFVSSKVWDSQALSIAPASQEGFSSELQDSQQSWESSDCEIEAVLELQSSSFLSKKQLAKVGVPSVSNKRILNEIKKTLTEKRSILCRQKNCFIITKSLQQFLTHLSLDHTFDKNFFCLFCPRFYSSSKCVRIHIVRSHSSETKQSDEFLQENKNFVSESETRNETVETFEKHLKIIQKMPEVKRAMKFYYVYYLLPQ